ncbi:type II toxin-antitoxin system RelE/ParE family toxin [Bosea sp. 685]|uniref:type II toxin-antitoxin system RelE/ParE family toxin n=1 Tax=Bosea sp. 685 TaxID=3080057 RepID=UPI00289347E3|nr:type II toxin-antitoxin system RelE/ParE family toxin [Bosea sp. 685]WNJ89287.1 type II toxin-antitoxin system RelE/ParE family toxin [Bosea sp. 685]
MKLEWSGLAVADRERIFDYVATDNPRAAVMLDERIEQHVEVLLAFPESGRPGRVEGTRELIVGGTPYIAAYHIGSGVIRILRILHMSQLWPDGLS